MSETLPIGPTIPTPVPGEPEIPPVRFPLPFPPAIPTPPLPEIPAPIAYQPGDLVRIDKQPPAAPQIVVNERAYISAKVNAKTGEVNIVMLSPQGTESGTAAVPYSCLAPETSEAWRLSHQLNIDARALALQNQQHWSQRSLSVRKEICAKHGITLEALDDIMIMLNIV